MKPRTSPPAEDLLEHTGFVRNLARGALGQDDRGEDVAQDAWVAALERGPREPAAARGWFYRVVMNRVASLKRRDGTQGRHLRQAAHQTPAPVPSPAEILAREEARRWLVAALLELDALYREPLVLKYYEDLKPRQIAQRLGLPVETVRTRQKRGIAQLRAALDRQHGDRRRWMAALVPLTRLPTGGTIAAATATSTVLGSLGAKLAVATALGLGVVALAVWRPMPSGDESPVAPASTPDDGGTERAELRGSTLGGPAEGADPADPERPDADEEVLPATYTVTVVDYDGIPVVGARVRVAETRPEWTLDREAIAGAADEDGCFRVPRTASPEPGENVSTSSFVLEIRQPVDRDDLQDFRLESWQPGDATVRMERGFVITGELVDHAGWPVPGALVELEDGMRHFRVETDAFGAFRCPGLPAGRWRTRVALRTLGEAIRNGERLLDSGSQAVRLEVTAGPRILVQLPDYDPRDRFHLETLLQVTEYDPGTGEDTHVSAHAVSSNGTVWLYGVREDRRYAISWKPYDRYAAYAPAATMQDERIALPLERGRPLTIEVVRPDGWTGRPLIRVHARGIEVWGAWRSEDHYVVEGLPDGEYHVEARGLDAEHRVVRGEARARAGGEATLVLSRD